eukprot:487794-Pelagomonas_calceolata.AAC.2
MFNVLLNVEDRRAVCVDLHASCGDLAGQMDGKVERSRLVPTQIVWVGALEGGFGGGWSLGGPAQDLHVFSTQKMCPSGWAQARVQEGLNSQYWH